MDFTEEKQLVIAATESKNAISCYVGYSFNKHIGFSTGISSMGRNFYEAVLDKRFIDHELAFYQPINQNLMFGMNVGLGYGNQEIENYDIVKPRKQFFRPFIGYTSDHFEFALSSQLVRAKFLSDNLDSQNLTIDDAEYYFLEPALTIGVGIKESKLRIQYVGSFKLNPERINYLPGPTINFSIHTRIRSIDR